ncbi:hypothetical protein PENTCL1PPCAC_6335, partial [Pristionchus entomophagus]
LVSDLVILGHVLESEDGLLTASSNDGKVHSAIVLLESSTDLVSELSLGETDIVLGLAVLGVHKRTESIGVNVHEQVLLSLDDGDVHVMGRGADILELLAGEDVKSDKVNLGVTVLSGLGGRHVDDLAGASLDHDMLVLAESRALLGESRRGSRIGLLEVLLIMIRHFDCLVP